jgi:hypothetical protein
MDDLGSSVPEVSVEFFFKHTAPQVRAIDTLSIKAKLVHSGHITNNRWDVFTKDPADANVHEAIAFNPFGKVIEQIAECSGLDSSEKQLDFIQNPHQAPHSERSNDTRPDSFLVRRSKDSQTSVRPGSEQRDISPNILWDDIAVSGEYKKKAGDKEIDDVSVVLRLLWVILTSPTKDVRKVVWSMHHVLRSDPCRRFTFGFTVENTNMWMWFAGRSGIFVTTPFNFMTVRSMPYRRTLY